MHRTLMGLTVMILPWDLLGIISAFHLTLLVCSLNSCSSYEQLHVVPIEKGIPFSIGTVAV